MKGVKRCVIGFVVFGIALVLPAVSRAATLASKSVDIVVEDNSPQLAFAARQIEQALDRQKVGVQISSHASDANIHIYLGTRADAGPRGVGSVQVASAAESYALRIPSSHVIVVKGSDTTGAMYGALDLAEQISWAEGNDFVRQIKPRSRSPFLKIRGINYFFITQDIDSPGGSFWSNEYWRKFFDMMARDRYNLLDIHGPCDDVTIDFPDGFCYFTHLHDFPKIGVGAERAAKNMARFREIIHMAAERGVKIAYMNYSSRPFYGAWHMRRFGSTSAGLQALKSI